MPRRAAAGGEPARSHEIDTLDLLARKMTFLLWHPCRGPWARNPLGRLKKKKGVKIDTRQAGPKKTKNAKGVMCVPGGSSPKQMGPLYVGEPPAQFLVSLGLSTGAARNFFLGTR